MITLRLAFDKSYDVDRKFENLDLPEPVNDMLKRVAGDVPLPPDKELKDILNVVINGHLIAPEFFDATAIHKGDTVLLTPKIGSGDGGQIFKQVLIIGITIAASYFLGPAVVGLEGAGLGAAVAGVSIAATLILSALIPPPPVDLGDLSDTGTAASSQMYSITGQSNSMLRFGNVPKVYGSFRMFPNVAAAPYTELSVDPDSGETIQYFYCIFDFGMGTGLIDQLSIGDTPLTTDSFEDFQYRFVDPNLPAIADQDQYDQNLTTGFEYYRGKRAQSSLSITLADGDENIQFSDQNSALLAQEIILEFVAGSGLFSFSSNGDLGNRTIHFEIDFAKVGTTDWHSYDDLNFVDAYNVVGGNDTENVNLSLASDGSDVTTSPYYQAALVYGYTYGVYENNPTQINIKQGQNKLLVVSDSHWGIGAQVFYGSALLGVVTAVVDKGSNKSEIALDRNIEGAPGFWGFRAQYPAYYVQVTSLNYQAHTTTTTISNVTNLHVTTHGFGQAAMTGNSENPVYACFRFTPKEAAQYQVRVKRISTDGDYTTQTQDQVIWGAITTAYMINPVNTKLRHVFLELKIKATDQLNGSIQNLSAVYTGVIPVYDSVTQTWTRKPTSNPAWIFADLLTGEVNKKAITKDRLDIDSFVEYAEFCDEVPASPPGQTFVNPRFLCNFILDYQTTLQQVLAQVGGMSQASLNIINGKHGILLDKRRDVPVQIFTPRNSNNFMSSRNYVALPDAVDVSFVDPTLNWDTNVLPVYDDGLDFNSATVFDELTAFGTTNHEQAYRFGRYMIGQNRLRQETIQVVVDFEHLICSRGDFVQITQDVMRVGGTPCRVLDVNGTTIRTDDSLDIDAELSYGYTYRSSSDASINTSTCTPLTRNTYQVDGEVPAIGDLIIIGEVGFLTFDCIVKSIAPNDDLSATVTLIEKADAIYDAESGGVFPDYNPQISQTSDPDFDPPSVVTNLVIGDNFWECNPSDSGYVFYIEITWSMPLGSVFEYFEIWVNDGTGYKMVTTTTSKLYKYIVNSSRLGSEHGFKVIAISASGKKVLLIAAPEVTATPVDKTTPPSDVTNLNMSITNEVLQLSWDSIADCDCAQYQIRYSPETNDIWEASIPLQTVSKQVNSVSVQARTGIYFIKAFDLNGNQSTNSADGITTIPNLFDLNIIDSLNDAPDFNGVFTQTELFGEAVILSEQVHGDANTVVYYTEGFYESENVLDLGDVFSVRLQSLLRADGYKFGELMANWVELADVDHLNSSQSDDWNVGVEYRATDVFSAISEWAHLNEIDHINQGAGVGFTDWRPIPTTGDATGRIFQFRIKLESFTANVTPRLFDGTIEADMPDRIDSFENLHSTNVDATVVAYDVGFNGPSPSPNIQISIDNAQSGDYWSFDSKSLEGFAIRFYDKTGTQVARQFDVVAKGWGSQHTTTI